MRRAKNHARRQRGVRRLIASFALGGALLLGLGFALGRQTAPQPRPHAAAKVTAKRAPAKRRHAARPAPAVPRAIDAPIQASLKARLSAQHFSGTGIVIKHGRLVASVSLGMASVKRHLANREDTLYEIDSLQKSLTGGLVMQLLDAGKLTLTTPIGNYYPQFKHDPQLTVGALMRMQSGLRATASLVPHYRSDAQLVNAVASRLTFQRQYFGTWAYTPANYVLLAGIVEKITGRSYEALFKAAYPQRLHLTHTVMAYALKPGMNYASGYVLQGSQLYAQQQFTSLDQMHAELGTGQVYMSALDFYQAVRSLMRGRLLGASRDQVYRPGEHYCGGFYQDVPGFMRANGSGYGYISTMQLARDGQAAVILLGNVQGHRRADIIQVADQMRREFLQ